jgi:glycosyltransferase involved in cell wall biosynthesis
MPSRPLVSIIVPNFNHQAFLRERLESVFAQTYQDFELILLDDASTDGSLEILEEFANRPRVRLVVNDTNSGSPFAQWNRGVELAQGEYVWIAESDDSANPELLENLVAVLEQHPTVGLAECDSERIDGSGRVLGPIARDAHPEETARWSQDFFVNGPEEVQRYLYLQNTIPSASAVVFRRSMYLKAGPAEARLKLTGDWLQWVKMLMRSDRYFLAQCLSQSRIHEGTQRETAAQNGRLELEALDIQKRIRQLGDIDRKTVRQGAARYATSWIQAVRSILHAGRSSANATSFRPASLM